MKHTKPKFGIKNNSIIIKSKAIWRWLDKLKVQLFIQTKSVHFLDLSITFALVESNKRINDMLIKYKCKKI